MITFSDAIIVAIISMISSGVATLLPTLIQSRDSEKRMKLERQVKLIEDWRRVIDQFDFENENFRATTTYTAMRPYADESAKKFFEAQRTYFVPPDGVSDAELRRIKASTIVTTIEQKWKLI